MLSFAYKWLEEKKTYVKALPDYPLYKLDPENDLSLITDLWALFNEADIVVAHNGVAFDTKKTYARFIHHRLPPPESVHEIDTKLVAKRYFKFDSNKLDDLGDYLGVGRKLQTGGFVLWKDCIDGNPKAWAKMCKYNKGDVDLLEKIYLCMRPYIKTHPNVALMNKKIHNCPKCNSPKTQKRGFALTRVSRFQRWQCLSCGGWSQSTLKDNSQIR